MGVNLMMTLQKFKEKYANGKTNSKAERKHYGLRNSEGWLPLRQNTYSASLGRFYGGDKISEKIVDELEKKGKYIFSEHTRVGGFNALEEALEKVTLYLDKEILYAIADFGASEFMLDRKAFNSEGKENKYNLTWFIRK